MTTYVLVPGFWLGAWAWRAVTEDLRARGHQVHPLSLTGLADRVHLASPAVDLDTHVEDVLNLLRYEDLTDVVLVGHSYAGTVVTAVADRAPERLRRLVYVDTGPLPDGVAQEEFGSPEERAANAEAVAERGAGWRLPPPDWAAVASGVDLPPGTVETLTERAVAQPWATATSPVSLTGAWAALPRLGVLCEFTAEQAVGWAEAVPMFRHMAGEQWEYVELPTWHWPMFSRPADLAEILHAA